MPTPGEPPSPQAAALIRAAAADLLEGAGSMFEEMASAGFAAAPVLTSDEALVTEVRVTNRANVVRWLTVAAERPGDRVGPDLTPEALDLARDLVRRGIDREALWTAYRQGQNVAWRRLMMGMTARAAREPMQVEALGEALDVAARSMFAFVDDILVNVDAQIDRERDQLLPANLANRLETVQLVLQGAPISEQRASARLGYELAGEHLGLVLWSTGADAGPGALEHAADLAARAAGVRSPFVLPAGTSVLWAWLRASDPIGLEHLTERIAGDLPPDIHVAIGTRASGAAGFRRSHEEALAVQEVVQRRGASGGGLTSYRQVEVAVLAGADRERAAHFVATTLGALLDARPELRETLRVNLQEQGSVSRAAQRLFTHRNTVRNRLARAEALLPDPHAIRPLSVALALELDHWLGDELARPTPG